MIINIRGTSGSGKSFITREIMKLYTQKSRVMVEKRKQPLGYILNGFGSKPLAVIGHYETACGGCDTISGYDFTFQKIREAADNGYNVLFEGLLLSGDQKFTRELRAAYPDLHIFAIDLPLADCVASINERRRAKKGDDAPPVDPANTEAKYKTLKKLMDKFIAEGYNAKWTTREETLEQVKALLAA